MKKIWLTLITSVLAGCAGQPDSAEDTPAGPAAAAVGTLDLSTNIRPQDDFFGYVNGNWLERTEIPPQWSSYGTTVILYERTESQVRELIERAAAATDPDATDRMIGDLYASFMNTESPERLGLAPLEPDLARIEAIRTYDDLIAFMAVALESGIQVPINFYVDADAANPDRSLAYFWQDGLGLPDRDYYLEEDPKLAEVRAQYAMHIEKLFELAGWGDGADAALVISDLETQIAELHWTRVQNRDRERIYQNKTDIAGAEALSPGFAWTRFLEDSGFGQPDRFVIAQTDYFAALGELIRSNPISNWQTWLRFKLLKAYAPYLNEAVVAEDFDFQRRILRGQEEMRPRWKRGIMLVNNSIGEAVGQRYVAEHFPPDAKAGMDTMIADLTEAFRQSIGELDWMTAQTRDQALQKLALFSAKIGYPEEWRDYSALNIDRNDLVGNVRRAREFAHDFETAKLDKPVDRGEWGMTPQTVNAYYRPTMNEIVFPAAILQPPFFDPTTDAAFNYGAIGAVIGHEISHGFDDQGRKFDGTGRLNDWWLPEDAAEYEARSAVLVDQYAAFEPLPGLHIDGRLTLGENIADLAGVIMAHRAYRLSLGGKQAAVIDGLTGDQRFFIGYAIAWQGKIRDERLREALLSDPHSPARYRVNGVLPNVAEFVSAFDVGPGDSMYRPPEERVVLW